MLRLPHEVKDIFRAWLDAHLPQRAAHVMSLVQQMQGGLDYNPEFGVRQKGTGEYATLFAQRFRLACKRLGLNAETRGVHDTSQFRVPPQQGDQLSLI